jgi:CubicO group peptidase (beta-lactamase class C family)
MIPLAERRLQRYNGPRPVEPMSKRHPLLRLTMALSLSAGVFVHGADDFLLSRFSEYLNALRVQAGIPGLAAAIVGSSDLTWEGLFGYQDVERNLPVRFDTPFQLDDTTQAIVASLAVRCASEGRLSLDDPIGRFVPSSPEAGATVGQLLTHTFGPVSNRSFSYRPERLEPIAAAVAACSESTFRAAVAKLFEDVSMVDSVPGADIVRVVPPAEGFDAADLNRYADALRRLATPYAVDKRNRTTPSSYAASTLTPASGLISSIRDLEWFDLRLKDKFMRPEWQALAWTPPTNASGRPLPHAYGWFVQDYNGDRLIWQFGVSDNASSSMIIMVPRRKVTLILLANSQGLARPFSLTEGDVTVSPFARLFLSIFVR